MVRKTLIISFVLVTSFVVPQLLYAGWTRIYGTEGWDWGACVRQTTDDNYIVTGTKSVSGYKSALWLLRADSGGDTLWTRAYGTEEEFIEAGGYCIDLTPDEGYMVFGSLDFNMLFLKTDAQGDTLWTRTYGGEGWEEGLYGAVTSDGGYICVGKTESYSPTGNDFDVFLVKIDTAGNLLWRKNYGGDQNDEGYCVRETSDGGYIITGYTESFASPTDEWGNLWLLKTDENGDVLWNQVYGGEGADAGMDVLKTSDGGYLICGYTYSSFAGGEGDLWLLRTNSLGDTLWSRLYGGEYEDQGGRIKQTSDGGYIITAGTWISDEHGFDLWLFKIDSEGDILWTRTYGGEGSDWGHWVEQTSDLGYIVTGRTASFGDEDGDLWLLKTDANGDTISSFVIEKPVVEEFVTWRIVKGFGPEIVLSYSGLPSGFHAEVLDVAGRKVDEIHADESSGIITWPVTPATPVLPATPVTHQSPGIYFIRVESDNRGSARKVVLIK